MTYENSLDKILVRFKSTPRDLSLFFSIFLCFSGFVYFLPGFLGPTVPSTTLAASFSVKPSAKKEVK